MLVAVPGLRVHVNWEVMLVGEASSLTYPPTRVRWLETAGSVGSWSVQAFSSFLSGGSELGKLQWVEDLQAMLEFTMLQLQEKVTVANKRGNQLAEPTFRVGREGGCQSPFAILSGIWPAGGTKNDSREDLGGGIH